MYYNLFMKYFEHTLTYNQIAFCLSNKPDIEEREIHLYHEILFYIGGGVKLLTKNGGLLPEKNSLIIIPQETYHMFQAKHMYWYH